MQRVRTVLVSDISGEDVDANGESIQFSYRGVQYSIDLSRDEADAFDKAMAPYLEHGQRIGGRSRAARTTSDVDTRAVRRWAEARNIKVPSRGRIPNAVIEQFKAAGN